MNYLAHLLLADTTPHVRLGSILPDLVRGRLPHDLPAGVLEGVRQHRRVDAFTDTHPLHAASRRRFAAFGHFAGIVTDIIYDHYLARGWDHHSLLPLDRFADEVHRDLIKCCDIAPAPAPQVVRRLVAERWLTSYATAQGMHTRLTQFSGRVSERLGRTVELASALDVVRAQDNELAGEFAAFFADLVKHMQTTAPRDSIPRR